MGNEVLWTRAKDFQGVKRLACAFSLFLCVLLVGIHAQC